MVLTWIRYYSMASAVYAINSSRGWVSINGQALLVLPKLTRCFLRIFCAPFRSVSELVRYFFCNGKIHQNIKNFMGIKTFMSVIFLHLYFPGLLVWSFFSPLHVWNVIRINQNFLRALKIDSIVKICFPVINYRCRFPFFHRYKSCWYFGNRCFVVIIFFYYKARVKLGGGLDPIPPSYIFFCYFLL